MHNGLVAILSLFDTIKNLGRMIVLRRVAYKRKVSRRHNMESLSMPASTQNRRSEFALVLTAMILMAIALLALKPAFAQDTAALWVGKSELSHGKGLAAAYAADENISDHRAVIFADDFEAGELGNKWDDTNNRGGNALALVNRSADGAPVGTRSLQVTAKLGENNGGGFTKWFESSDQIFVRFYTKFHSDCDYVHHFCTLRANKSLRGRERWSGFGGAGELPNGGQRFSTAIEPWGNWRKWKPPGQWNFYSYWHTMKPSPDGKYWGNGFRLETQSNIQRDKWICVEMMLKHNTPGKEDGEQAYWIDGELQGHWRGINWRTSPTLFANAFTLESYVTDRWTKQKENVVYFDNVVIARQYIGPAKDTGPAKPK